MEKFTGFKKNSKMKYSILNVVCTLVLLSACQNNSDSTNIDAEETTISHEDHALQKGHCSLNNGNKWIANSETTEGINNMIALMTAFTPQQDTNDYSSLEMKLEREFNLILQKCTMTGEAHEQLHNYLTPMPEFFKKLKSEDKEVRHKAFNGLKQHLSEYENYFQ